MKSSSKKSRELAVAHCEVAEANAAPKHQPPSRMRKLQYMVENFLGKYNEDLLAEFKSKLNGDDPAYAFEWGRQGMEAAARIWAGRQLEFWLEQFSKGDEYVKPEPEEVAGNVLRKIEEEVIRRARWPESSTSPVSNQIAIYRLAALAEVVAKVRYDSI